MSLTKADWKNFDKLLDQKLEDKIGPLREQISHLPNKEEFYLKMDQWMKAASTSELEKASHKQDHERIREFISSCQA